MDGMPTPAAIPLETWVDHLIYDYGETAAPDTVEEKVIDDTDDPHAFDAFLTEDAP